MSAYREQKADLTSQWFSLTIFNTKSWNVFIHQNIFFAVMSKHLDFVCAILIDELNKDYPECEYF